MEVLRLQAGLRVQYHNGDGHPCEGTVAKTVHGIGYSIVTLSGKRKLVPVKNLVSTYQGE